MRCGRSATTSTAQAAAVVDAALATGEVDGVDDVATALPMAVVPDLVGWPRDQRDNLLPWGGATFDVLGPLNRHALKVAARRAADVAVRPSGRAHARHARGQPRSRRAAGRRRGQAVARRCSPLMVDYIAPSLDTTISAISNALYLFATHPEQWQLLQGRSDADPQRGQRGDPLRVSAAGVLTKGASATPTSRARRSRPGHGSSSSTPRPTATNASGTTPTRSTSAATPPVNSASARARTPAPARAWPGWRRPPCCGPSPSEWSASRSPATADVGDQQHHPPPRAAAAQADRRLTGCAASRTAITAPGSGRGQCDWVQSTGLRAVGGLAWYWWARGWHYALGVT